MSDWKETTLGILLKFANGKTSPERAAHFPYAVYGSNGIIGKSKATNADPNSIIIGRVGSYCGSVFYSQSACWVTDNAIRASATAGNIPRFLYYLLQGIDLNHWRGGSGQPLLNQTVLSSIPTSSPGSDEQKAIAHVLGSLDDRIELNRRMNETLESMAQALFKSWFVDFDPVIDKALAGGKEIPEELSEKAQARAVLGDNRRPLPEEIRTLFPDEFTYSNDLGWIPEGWEVGSLVEIALLKTSSVQPKNEPETVWTHFSIPAFDENRLPNNELGSTIKSGKYMVPPTAILASKLNPQFPRVWLPDVEKDETAICSTEFMPFVPLDTHERPFLYAFFNSSIIQEKIVNRATGSTGSRQRVRPREIASMSILKPPQRLRVHFSNIAGSYYSKVAANIRAARYLEKLRNTLLPKLLSGELRIPDAEKMVEELAL